MEQLLALCRQARSLVRENVPKHLHPLYSVWQGMLQRCHNPKQDSYQDYGARGVFVCARWRNSFYDFIDDMGPRPSKLHSIDRIDNDGPYSPENCQWATKTQQVHNRRNTRWIEFHGERLPLGVWAQKTGIKYDTLKRRLLRGMPIERVMIKGRA